MEESVYRLGTHTRTKAAQARIYLSLAVSLVILLGCANAGDGDGENSASEGPVIAQIDGDPILLGDVDTLIKEQLFAEKFPPGKGDALLYQARRDAIDEIVDSRLVNRSASAESMTEEAWLAQKISELAPVSDADVNAFFEGNQGRFGPGATLEKLSGPIRDYLEAQKEQQVRDALRQTAAVEITLPRERKTVAAVGYSMGPENAPITIVEFSDFQCPYCSRVVPTLKEIVARYPDEVRVVFRHLPLDFHAQARGAAMASICAGQQEKFWEYHDLLFANQRAMGRDQLSGYATGLGLDMELFEACMAAPETDALVAADLEAAERLGATGTPSFFINGIFLNGAQPVEAFERLIQEELAESRS